MRCGTNGCALLLERGKTPDQLAEHVQVDAKTVERWITMGRLPYRRHRFEVASFLGVDESYIWPDALGQDEVAVVSESEVVAVYPHRTAPNAAEQPLDFGFKPVRRAARGGSTPDGRRNLWSACWTVISGVPCSVNNRRGSTARSPC